MMRIALVDDSIEICEMAKSTIEESVEGGVTVDSFTNPEMLL